MSLENSIQSKNTIENLNNNINAIQHNNSIEISKLKNYYEFEISNLKNKYYFEILQNHKDEISNLKKYYENENLNIQTYYKDELLNLKKYNESEVFKLKNDYNQIINNHKIEILNLKDTYDNEIFHLKNTIFSLKQQLNNPSIELFLNIFKNNINNLSNLLYKKQYEEKCFPPTDPNEFMKMMDFVNLKSFVLMFFNTFKSDNQKEIDNNDIIELDEDNIFEDIDINENNFNTEFTLALNNFITTTSENERLTEFRR
ncbi:6233_t:CDS:2, partial [Racocetra fulgida]